jgi:hypothetical protein
MPSGLDLGESAKRKVTSLAAGIVLAIAGVAGAETTNAGTESAGERDGWMILPLLVAVLGVVAVALRWRAHRKVGPLLCAGVGALFLILGATVWHGAWLLVVGFVALAIGLVWSWGHGGRCACACGAPAKPDAGGKAPVLESTITCPVCGHQRTETMPTDACLFFYKCEGCGTVLRPQPGDCCVFCSYGSVPCPPKRGEGTSCC